MSDVRLHIGATSDVKKEVDASTSAIRQLRQEVEATKAATEAANPPAKTMQATWVEMTVALVAVYAAFQKVKTILAGFLQEFVQDEAAAMRLVTALRISGQYSVQAASGLMELSNALARTTTYSHETSEAAAGLLMQLGNLTVHGVQVALPKLQDFATTIGVDLSSAAEMMTAAMEGARNMFIKYGADLSGATTASERFDIIIQTLTEHFPGMADAMGKTAGGQLVIFKNQVDEIRAALGELEAALLMPAIQALNLGMQMDKIFKADLAGASLETLRGYATVTSAYLANLEVRKGSRSIRPGEVEYTTQFLASVTEAIRHASDAVGDTVNVLTEEVQGWQLVGDAVDVVYAKTEKYLYLLRSPQSGEGAPWSGERVPWAPATGASLTGAPWTGEKVPGQWTSGSAFTSLYSENGNPTGGYSAIGQGAAGGMDLSGITSLMGQFKSLSMLLDPFNTILSAAVAVLKPFVNAALAPLVGALVTVGMAIGQILIPVIQLLTPVIQLLGEIFVWLYNNVILVFGNMVIGFVNVLENIGIGLHNFFDWLFNGSKNQVAYRGVTEGFLQPISMASMTAAGSSAIAGAEGGGASYSSNTTVQPVTPVYISFVVQGNMIGTGSQEQLGAWLIDTIQKALGTGVRAEFLQGTA